MASSGWSNIFLQLMAGDTPPKIGLPVIGEGRLEMPWAMQIELLSFSWSFEIDHKAKEDKGSLLGAAAGMAAGAVVGNLAGAAAGQAGLAAAAVAAAAVSAIKDFQDIAKVKSLGLLKMTKRFDIASSRIQACVDNNLPIHSALISVLHIKQGARSIHEPGFTILATDGRFEKVDIKMEKGDKGVEVTEDLELRFKNIVVTYSKRLGIDNIPMPPFVYFSPKDPKAGPSLPSF
jgi:type VI protein secretion system component Hcp